MNVNYLAGGKAAAQQIGRFPDSLNAIIRQQMINHPRTTPTRPEIRRLSREELTAMRQVLPPRCRRVLDDVLSGECNLPAIAQQYVLDYANMLESPTVEPLVSPDQAADARESYATRVLAAFSTSLDPRQAAKLKKTINPSVEDWTKGQAISLDSEVEKLVRDAYVIAAKRSNVFEFLSWYLTIFATRSQPHDYFLALIKRAAPELTSTLHELRDAAVATSRGPLEPLLFEYLKEVSRD